MRKIPLILQILMGFVLGTLGGLFLSEWGAPQLKENITGIVSPFGNLLVAMLKMVVFPMILFSLIHGAASLPLRKSGKVGGWVMVWYFATSLFATLFGVVLASFLNPVYRCMRRKTRHYKRRGRYKINRNRYRIGICLH